MKIHIYHHFEDCDKQKQLDRIEKKIDQLLDLIGVDASKEIQELIDKLDLIIGDVKSTVDPK